MANPVTTTTERTEQGWRVVCGCGVGWVFVRDKAASLTLYDIEGIMNHLSGLDGTHKAKERET